MSQALSYSGESVRVRHDGRVVSVNFNSGVDADEMEAGFAFLKTTLSKEEHLAYVIVLDFCPSEHDLHVMKSVFNNYLSYFGGVGVRNVVALCECAPSDYLSMLKDFESEHIATHFFFNQDSLNNWLLSEFKNDAGEYLAS